MTVTAPRSMPAPHDYYYDYASDLDGAVRGLIIATAATTFRVAAQGSSVDNRANLNAAIAAANAVGGFVLLGTGTHRLSGYLDPLTGASMVAEQGARFTLASTYVKGSSAGIITLVGQRCTVAGFSIVGGTTVDDSTNTATNKAVGAAISLGAGAMFTTIRNLDLTAVNGWCVEGTGAIVGGMYGLLIDGVRGYYNGGGFHLVGAASANYGVQGIITNCDLQVVMSASILDFEDTNDVQVSNVNGCVAGNVVGAYGVKVSGVSSSIFVYNGDLGSYPTVPGIEPIVRVTGTPNNVRFYGGVYQSGLNAFRIEGGFNVGLHGVQVSRSAADGVLITGGDRVFIDSACVFSRNGKTPPRVVTDASTTTGSPVVPSQTAAFTAADQYKVVVLAGFPAGTFIASVDSPTQVTMSANATATGAGLSLTVGVHAEIRQTTATPNVKIQGNSFQTPAGTGVEQVPHVLRLSSSTNNTLFYFNDILGGHSKDSSAAASTFAAGAPPKRAKENLNYNPYGAYTAAQKPIPATGANTSGTHIDLDWYVTAGASACTVTLKNLSSPNPDVPITIPAGQLVTIRQPAGGVLGFSYTAAPTAVTIGM